MERKYTDITKQAAEELEQSKAAVREVRIRSIITAAVFCTLAVLYFVLLMHFRRPLRLNAGRMALNLAICPLFVFIIGCFGNLKNLIFCHLIMKNIRKREKNLTP